MKLKAIGNFYISEDYKLYKDIGQDLYECDTYPCSCKDCDLYKKFDRDLRICREFCNGGIILKETDIWDYEKQKFKKENVLIVQEFENKKITIENSVINKNIPNTTRPDHYKMTINGQTIEVMDILKAVLTPEEMRGFNKGNIIKYILRERNKNGIADIKKCKQYAEFMLGDEE